MVTNPLHDDKDNNNYYCLLGTYFWKVMHSLLQIVINAHLYKWQREGHCFPCRWKPLIWKGGQQARTYIAAEPWGLGLPDSLLLSCLWWPWILQLPDGLGYNDVCLLCWLVVIVSLRESRFTLETGLWGISLFTFTDVGRSSILIISGPILWAGDPGCIKWRRAENHDHINCCILLTMGVMQPTASSFCCFGFSAMIDCTLCCEPDKTLPP